MGIIKKILKDDESTEATVATEVKKAAPAVEEKKVVAKKVSKEPKKQDPTIFRIISNPQISEKATDLASINKYIFIVPVTVNKTEIAKKIRNLYGVIPEKVNIIRKAGKHVRYGKRSGDRVSFKKAIVTLKEGERIEVYEGV